jgi:hypothetical protein
MILIKFLGLFSFIFAICLDYFIKNNLLGTGLKQVYFNFIGFSYFSIVLILTFIIFLILMLLDYFGIYLICFESWNFDNDLINFMSDNNTNTSTPSTTNVNTDAKVTLNQPSFSINVPVSAVNNLAGAASAAAGAGAAIKAMQHMPGGPGVKAVAGGATMLGVQAVSYGMSKIFNSKSSNTNNTTNKLFNYLDMLDNNNINNNNNLTNLTKLYNEFPLNLLPDIDQLLTVELMFLFIILNVYVVKFISKIDYNKYIFDNKFGTLLIKIINRYIIMWSKSVKFLLILSWIGVFICVIFSKIFIYYIMNP